MTKMLLKKEIWLLIAVLIVVGGFIYFFNLNNQLFWDDEDWIIRNNFVHTISWDNVKFWFTHNTLGGVGLRSNYYRPFLFFTFALNYVISGIKPFGYHLFSNLIHITNGVLVFSILYSVFRRKLLAFLTSLIFLIHPLQTEAITYISGRGDALVTFFMLLALACFLKSKGSTLRIFKVEPWMALSLGCLVLGLLSRETAIIFPFLTLAFYVSFMSSSRFDRVPKEWESHSENLENAKGRTFLKSLKQGLIKTWPYFVVVLVYGVLRLTLLNFQNTLNFYTVPNIYSENLYVRILTFLPILWEYLKLLVVPVGLHMERDTIVYTSLFQWPVWPMFLGLVGLLAWLRYLYKNQRIVFPIWFFGVALFFISLGPVSGITPINALLYEHWLYLPMVGFWLIFSFYLVKLLDHQGSTFLKIQGRTLMIMALVVYLSFFAYQSIQRNLLWGSQLDFYLDILKHEPDSARINNNVGNIYYNQKDWENAEKYYRIAASQEGIFAQPHFNLGTILQAKGDISGAIRLYEKAIEIDSNFYYPYQNLAAIYAQQGDLIKAIENIEKLKLIIPNNPRVYYNSALVYIALNKKEQALDDLKEGLKYVNLDPETGKLIEGLIGELRK